MPQNQEEVVVEIARIKGEMNNLNAQRKWLEGQLKAVQSLCSHPKWHHDNDPRGPSSHCLVCGYYQ